MLAPISAARVPPDRAIIRIRQEALRRRQQEQREREEAQRRRARRQREAQKQASKEQAKLLDAEALGQLKGQLSETEALLDLAERERDEAEARTVEAEKAEAGAFEEAVEHSDHADRLAAELSAVRSQMRTMEQYGSETEEAGVEADPIPEELEDWDQIAEYLDELEGPGFVLADQARSCASGKSRYPHPGDMWKGLRGLEQVGRAYNELGASIKMRFEQFAMERAGIEVALQDNSYLDCWFEYENRWYERVPHVKLDDAKSPNEVGRIYFALDSAGRRVIVDWFGTKPDRPVSKRPDKVAT